MTQEFQISVTPLGNNEYLVRTEEVAPGVPPAEEKVRWSVENWWEQTQRLMNDPLLSLLQDTDSVEDEFLFLSGTQEHRSVSSSSFNLVELGRQLYDALFQGSLRDSWITAQGIAKHQSEVLRLRLGLKDSYTARLPWEVLHAGGKGSYGSSFRPLATGIDVAFSRYQPNTPQSNSELLPSFHNHYPLRILMVLAAPEDKDSLELKQEAMQLQAELNRNYSNSNTIELNLLEQPGREELTQALEQGQYQVFHYAGHSNFGDSGGNIYLVSRHTGLTEKLYGDDLAGLLVNNGIQLAVFNSCRGANANFTQADGDWQQSSLAQALVKRGVPAVLAMAERIPDEVALTLTRLLYRNINQGHPIDISLSRARQGLIAAYGSNQLYWALPVLYLHRKFDGVLINPNDEQNIAFINDVLGQYGTNEPLPETITYEATEEMESWQDTSQELDDDLAAAFIKDVLGHYSANEPIEEPVNQSMTAELEAEEDLADEFDDEQTAAFIKGVLSEFSEHEAALVPTAPMTPGKLLSSQAESLAHSDGYPESRITPVQNVALDETTLPLERKETKSKSKQKFQSKPKRQKPGLILLLGGTGLMTIVLAGMWWFSNRNPTPESLWLQGEVPSISTTTGENEKIDWQQIETPTVTGLAIDEFEKGNLERGERAVAALLDRGALPFAKAALDSVPSRQIDTPMINFLRGRLAWQGVLAGNPDYGLSDALRYWERAVKQKPNSIAFLNALGFAYYEQGNINSANEAWYDALELGSKESSTGQVDLTNTYAGLALGIGKLAQGKSQQQQSTLLNQALKLRQKVINSDPSNFQTDALGKNWLWSQRAIQDWQNLLTTTTNSSL